MPTDLEREQWRRYSKKYRDKNPEHWRSVRKKYNARKRDLVHEAKNKPCSDCKIQYPFYIMQFDHVRGEKLFDIGQHQAQGGWGFEVLKAEIEKCDVVCSNCHAERTYNRF